LPGSPAFFRPGTGQTDQYRSFRLSAGGSRINRVPKRYAQTRHLSHPLHLPYRAPLKLYPTSRNRQPLQ